MSHFTTYVFTKTDSKEELERLMLPYHEYECTGITEYCVHVDKTTEAIDDYEKYKEDYKSPKDFVDSWYGISEDLVYEEEPAKKPECSYAIIKDDKIIKIYDFTNPNSKWDYYGEYNWEANEFVNIPADVKVIKKSQFNIDAFMNARKEYYLEIYRKLKPYFTEDYITWEQAKKDNEDINKAREIYNAQKTIKDMNDKIGSGEMFNLRWNIDIDFIFTKTEDEFVQGYLNTAAPFWAMVLPTGEWIEKGHMGWWAVSWDEDENFNKTWTDLWKNIPDDCYIWKCDCHI